MSWVELLHAEIGWALERAGVDSLLIKGVSTSRWLSAAAGERSPADVDVLVAPASAQRAEGVLVSRGFHHVHAGTRPGETAAHSRVYQRTDPDLGGHEVDLHVTLPGSDGLTPPVVSQAWDAVWARRVREQVAGVDVWFPDVSTRALLVANQAARDGVGSRAAADLVRALEVLPVDGWADVAALARTCGLAASVRAGLEAVPEGAGAGPAAGRRPGAGVLAAARRRCAPLRDPPRGPAGAVVARAGPRADADRPCPSSATMRLRDPELAGRGPVGLAAAHLRRWGQGLASLPRSVREVRAVRRAERDRDGGSAG